MEDKLLTPVDMAEWFKKSLKAIYQDAAAGKWPVVKMNRRLYFKKSSIQALIDAAEIPAVSPPDPNGPRKAKG
jgi:hypothetical protein